MGSVEKGKHGSVEKRRKRKYTIPFIIGMILIIGFIAYLIISSLLLIL